MKTSKEYNFRVGDYVETAFGRIGYVTQITRKDAGNGEILYDITATCMNNEPNFTAFYGPIDKLKDFFNRIGKYDFTKEDQSKEIEQLPHCSNRWHKTVIDKINELVEVVNELRSGKNG